MENSSLQLPIRYSGKFVGSYAYITIKDRLPVTLVKVIDTLCQDKNYFGLKNGEVGQEDAKKAIGLLSGLQNEMITNKPIKPLKGDGPDVALWNVFLEKENADNDFPASWFDSSWLYVECYLYRRIQDTFDLCPVLNSYDPFNKQKEESLLHSMKDIVNLCDKINSMVINPESSDLYGLFKFFLEVSLWGNKCDLSLFTIHTMSAQTVDVEDLKSKILVDDADRVWSHLNAAGCQKEFNLHYVMDNAGFELFCDFCFLHFLCVSNLVKKVTLYVKRIPWFVSDTLEKDIYIMLDTFSNSKNNVLVDLTEQWRSNLTTGKWNIEIEQFWTLPNDFSEMSLVDPNLYNKLSQGDLVIFKGDLNYRKLLGDRQWPEDTPFLTALQRFLPTSLLALRTIKANTVAGLVPGTTEKLDKLCESWKFSGEYALIQFAHKNC